MKGSSRGFEPSRSPLRRTRDRPAKNRATTGPTAATATSCRGSHDRSHRPHRHNCRNVEATASWYEHALGFRRETYSSPAAPGQRIALKFGQRKFKLRQTGDASWWTCKVDAPGSLDLCFVTGGSLKPVIARLEAARIPIVAGPVPRSGALGP